MCLHDYLLHCPANQSRPNGILSPLSLHGRFPPGHDASAKWRSKDRWEPLIKEGRELKSTQIGPLKEVYTFDIFDKAELPDMKSRVC